MTAGDQHALLARIEGKTAEFHRRRGHPADDAVATDRRDAAAHEAAVRDAHRGIMRAIAPQIAGRYATCERYVHIGGGRHVFPVPAEVPALMADFAGWLATASIVPETAIAAHRRLVRIHPFQDGNGRTAWLLMNHLLLRSGQPALMRRRTRYHDYLAAMQRYLLGEDSVAFDVLMLETLNATLDRFLAKTAMPA